MSVVAISQYAFASLFKLALLAASLARFSLLKGYLNVSLKFDGVAKPLVFHVEISYRQLFVGTWQRDFVLVKRTAFVSLKIVCYNDLFVRAAVGSGDEYYKVIVKV